MSKTALQKLENVFSEEMFLRKQNKSYTIKDFQELSAVITEITDKDDIDSAIELSKKQIERNQQNVAALYSFALLNFQIKNHNEMTPERILALFKKFENWVVIEYLSKEILEYYESDYALRYLAHCYEITKRKGEALGVWERLVKFETSNPELPEKVAILKEESGNFEDATVYYKIAFERNLIKQRGMAETNIKKVLELKPDNFAYLSKNESTLAQLVSADVMIDIWKIIFFHYFENGLYDGALKTIKHLLQYEQSIVKQNNKKAKFFRHRLVEVYEALYPNHTLIEQIKEISNIINVFKDPKGCIEIFEKYIQYDTGKYVIHRQFGVGKIKDITIDSVIIKFVSQEESRKMTFDMAIKSLHTLNSDDINVYKAYKLKETKKIAEENPTELLEIILKYKKTITTKDLKQELVASVIEEASYIKWLENAKKKVRASTSVKFEKNTFLYNKNALSYDIETINKFESTIDFLSKYQIYMEYLHYSQNTKSEEASKMYDTFKDKANNVEESDIARIVSTILLKLNGDSDAPDLDNLVSKIKNHTEIYEVLPSASYREKYILSLEKIQGDEAYNTICKMLYSSHTKNHYIIVSKLINDEKVPLFEKTIADIFLHYKEHPESFLYFAQKILDKEYVDTIGKNIKINLEILMADMLSLIPYLNKFNDKKEVALHSRKMLKTVYDLIFEKEHLLRFIENEPEESVKKIYSEFQKITTLEQHYQTEIITSVTKRFPNL